MWGESVRKFLTVGRITQDIVLLRAEDAFQGHATFFVPLLQKRQFLHQAAKNAHSALGKVCRSNGLTRDTTGISAVGATDTKRRQKQMSSPTFPSYFFIERRLLIGGSHGFYVLLEGVINSFYADQVFASEKGAPASSPNTPLRPLCLLDPSLR